MQKTYEANGLNPQDAALAADGANKVMDVVQRMGAAAETRAGPLNTDIGRAGESWYGNLAKVFHPEGFVRQWAGVNIAEQSLKRATFEKLSEALTDPSKMKELMEMAKWNPVTNSATVLAWVAKNAALQSHIGEHTGSGMWSPTQPALFSGKNLAQ
jgi:hypothetical protein